MLQESLSIRASFPPLKTFGTLQVAKYSISNKECRMMMSYSLFKVTGSNFMKNSTRKLIRHITSTFNIGYSTFVIENSG